MQSMYLGISPFDAPAVYTLLPYTELAEDGLYYPEGGIYALPTAMAAVASKLGVEIETGQNVTQIMVKDGKARGVCVDGEMLPADIVISNADLPYTYTDLLAERPAESQRSRLEKAAVHLVGVHAVSGHGSGFIPSCTTTTFFCRRTTSATLRRSSTPKSRRATRRFYVNAPGRTDPSVAPPGHDNLFVLVPIPHLDRSDALGRRRRSRSSRDKVYDKLEARGLTDLRKHVVVEQVVTPHEWRDQYNLKYGAAFGLSHGILQVGYFRPSNKSPERAGPVLCRSQHRSRNRRPAGLPRRETRHRTHSATD